MAKKHSHEEFEQRIKELEKDEALRALLNATIESAVLINIEGKILAINQVGAQRLGKSADELIGVSVDDYLRSDTFSAIMGTKILLRTPPLVTIGSVVSSEGMEAVTKARSALKANDYIKESG